MTNSRMSERRPRLAVVRLARQCARLRALQTKSALVCWTSQKLRTKSAVSRPDRVRLVSCLDTLWIRYG
jgi:hypothetical protein